MTYLTTCYNQQLKLQLHLEPNSRFGWIIFATAWSVLVYLPVAHWVFSAPGLTAADGGWIVSHLRAIDFAGGTAVEINSGASALVLALIIGRRRGWPKDPMRPHNLPYVMLGAGLLWFGWFGFNAGSALAADGSAALIAVNTLGAGAASMVAWLVVEQIRHGHPTSFGAASGVVAGLVLTRSVVRPLREVFARVRASDVQRYCDDEGAHDVLDFPLLGGAEPPVDQGRVDEIRKAIEQGRYPVIPMRVADALIASGLLLRSGK